MSDAVYLLEAEEKSTKFSAPILQDENLRSENVTEYNRKLKNALRRLTGFSAFLGGLLTEGNNIAMGHFGEASKSGGIHPNGKFSVQKIK